MDKQLKLKVEELVHKLNKEAIYYEHKPEYKKDYILKIKKEYVRLCQADSTLSEDYKKHIEDFNNINVIFNYGVFIELEYDTLRFNVAYDYKDTVVTRTTIEGKVEYDDYGHPKVSDARERSDSYSTSFHCNDVISLNSTNMNSYVGKFGDIESIRKSNYLVMHSIQKKKGVSQKTQNSILTAEKLYDWLNRKAINDYEKDIYQKVKKKNSQAVSIKIDGVSDFDIDYGQAYYLPATFNILVNYNEEVFAQENVSAINNITSVGKKSDNFQIYEKTKVEIDRAEGYYSFPRVLTIFFAFVNVVIMWLLNQLSGENSSYLMKYIASNFFTFLPINIACALLGIGLCKFAIKEFKCEFDNKLQGVEIITSLQKKFKSRKIKNYLFAGIMMLVSILVAVLVYLVFP